MRTEQLLSSSLLLPPDFLNYQGGNSFTFKGKLFRKRDGALGQGASGEVFCFEADDHTTVAVKVENAYWREHCRTDIFQKEARWYQKIYGLGIFSGDPEDRHSPHYILMPYFEGITLDQIYYESAQELLFYWIKAADAVQTLHTKHQAVHGDLKPDNMIVDPNRKIFVIDFGLMTNIQEKKTTALLDTPANKQRFRQYPPESFSNSTKKIMAHPSQDIYALGILLHFLFACFLDDNAYSQPALKIIETIVDVQKNLTHEIPVYRWSIAKAIYMLTLAFFSQVPRHIWLLYLPEEKLTMLSHTNLMLVLWRETSNIAIAMRINELLDEQGVLEANGKTSVRKTQKIGGLRSIYSDIQITNPEQFGAIVSQTNKTFPELMAGIFSKRTKTLIDELSQAAAVFH